MSNAIYTEKVLQNFYRCTLDNFSLADDKDRKTSHTGAACRTSVNNFLKIIAQIIHNPIVNCKINSLYTKIFHVKNKNKIHTCNSIFNNLNLYMR